MTLTSESLLDEGNLVMCTWQERRGSVINLPLLGLDKYFLTLGVCVGPHSCVQL